MIRLRDIGVNLVVAMLLGTASSGEALSVGDKPRIDMRTLDGEILDQGAYQKQIRENQERNGYVLATS